MPFTFRPLGPSTLPVDFDGVVPDRLREKSAADVERIHLWQGRSQVQLGELFRVVGQGADESLRFEGDFSHVHRIGAGMASGRVTVDGSVGPHAGAEMTGGRLSIDGSAADWLGAQMHGGTIHCRGGAGAGLGAAYPGTGRGMAGGTIIVDGSVGSHAGRRMRRGLIAIGGEARDSLGAELLAGTILVRGPCGPGVGDAMRRGTIIALGPIEIDSPQFARAGQIQLVVLNVLARHLTPQAPWAGELADGRFVSYHGDMLELGRGELFVRQ